MDRHRQAMANHIMSMDAAEMRHAILHPIMMGMGAMVAMAGVYILMVMTEVNSANATAFAFAG